MASRILNRTGLILFSGKSIRPTNQRSFIILSKNFVPFNNNFINSVHTLKSRSFGTQNQIKKSDGLGLLFDLGLIGGGVGAVGGFAIFTHESFKDTYTDSNPIDIFFNIAGSTVFCMIGGFLYGVYSPITVPATIVAIAHCYWKD